MLTSTRLPLRGASVHEGLHDCRYTKAKVVAVDQLEEMLLGVRVAKEAVFRRSSDVIDWHASREEPEVYRVGLG